MYSMSLIIFVVTAFPSCEMENTMKSHPSRVQIECFYCIANISIFISSFWYALIYTLRKEVSANGKYFSLSAVERFSIKRIHRLMWWGRFGLWSHPVINQIFIFCFLRFHSYKIKQSQMMNEWMDEWTAGRLNLAVWIGHNWLNLWMRHENGCCFNMQFYASLSFEKMGNRFARKTSNSFSLYKPANSFRRLKPMIA